VSIRILPGSFRPPSSIPPKLKEKKGREGKRGTRGKQDERGKERSKPWYQRRKFRYFTNKHISNNNKGKERYRSMVKRDENKKAGEQGGEKETTDSCNDDQKGRMLYHKEQWERQG